jgi:hypothetical protein
MVLHASSLSATRLRILTERLEHVRRKLHDLNLAGGSYIAVLSFLRNNEQAPDDIAESNAITTSAISPVIAHRFRSRLSAEPHYLPVLSDCQDH